MDNRVTSEIWQQLKQHQLQWSQRHLRDVFSSNSERFSQFSLQHDSLLLDYSKNPLDNETLGLFCKLADAAQLSEAIDDLFNKNCHVKCRDPKSLEPVLLQMQSVIDSIDPEVTDIIHVGVGGSMAGQVLLYQTFSEIIKTSRKIHFVAHYDQQQLQKLLASLDPGKTLVIIASKSFATPETMHNARIIKQWLTVDKNMIAITANSALAREFGISQQQTLIISAGIGGRFSLWSSMSLVIAIAVGVQPFRQLLQGAFKMDQHFKTAAWQHNMPVILALIDVWMINFFGINNRAVVPYNTALRGLVNYLQQLHMESLGKSIDLDSKKVDYQTGNIIWGGVGTQCQHSFFQLFMQGKQQSTIDFILPLRDCLRRPVDMPLIANCLAQSEVMMVGDRSSIAEKNINGNIASNTLLMQDMTPESLGALLALYEHKVFVQSVIWNVNAFDQWGVERGKRLAQQLQCQLHDGQVGSQMDASTQGLSQYVLQQLSHKESVV